MGLGNRVKFFKFKFTLRVLSFVFSSVNGVTLTNTIVVAD